MKQKQKKRKEEQYINDLYANQRFRLQERTCVVQIPCEQVVSHILSILFQSTWYISFNQL